MRNAHLFCQINVLLLVMKADSLLYIIMAAYGSMAMLSYGKINTVLSPRKMFAFWTTINRLCRVQCSAVAATVQLSLQQCKCTDHGASARPPSGLEVGAGIHTQELRLEMTSLNSDQDKGIS